MNLLHWLFGKKPNSPPIAADGSPSRLPTSGPILIGPPDAGLPYIFVNDKGQTTLVDRMTYEYQKGRRPGTDPRPADLDALLARADRVRVLDGGLYRDDPLGLAVLADSNDPELLAALRPALAIVADPSAHAGHCACLGGPTIELFAGRDRLAALALHHGRTIRWPHWRHDATLRNPDALAAVLTRLGLNALSVTGTTTENQDPMQFARLALSPAHRIAARGSSYLARGELDHAQHEADLALALDPACEPAHILQAFIHIERDKPAEADAELTVAIDAGSHGPESYRVRAIARQRLGRFDEAIADCDAALTLKPDHAPSHHTRAHILIGLGRLDDAYAAASECVRLIPDHYEAYWLRAFIELNRGNPREAINDFNHLLTLLDKSGQESLDPTFLSGRKATPPGQGHRLIGPDRCGILLNRARANILLTDHDEAIADFELAQAADPTSIPAIESHAALLLQRDEFPRALKLYDQIIARLPDAPAYLARSQAHWQAGNHDAALADADAAINLSDTPDEIRGLRAELLVQAGRIDEARDELETLIAARPDDPRGYLLRALCWRHLGLLAEQRTDLEMALARDPANPRLLNSLAWMLAIAPDDSLRDGPRAVELARKADTLTESLDPNILDTLAAALAEDGQFGEAAETQRRAIARFKQLPFPVDLDKYRTRLALYESGQPLREDL